MAHYEFSASRVSAGGNTFFPDKIIIDDEFVIYRKSRVIGKRDIKVRHDAVGCVTLDKHLIFADIIIETRGGQVIKARGFTRGDAETIAELIG